MTIRVADPAAARPRMLGWLARLRLAGDGVLGGEPAAAVLRLAELGARQAGELARALGASALLRYVVHRGELLVVSVVDGRFRLHRLGAPPDAAALRFAIGRNDALTRREARRLDDALLAPVRSLIGERALVVVPGGGVPWAALPYCAGRAVSVAPSVTAWLRAGRTAYSLERAVWVAGPGLRHAEREVSALHAHYGGTLLRGRAASVDAVLAAAGGADLVHIAAHGRYRVEAPRYSFLELADGPLYGHDLAARVLVLSACEGALAAPLRPGTRALIASTVAVRDDAAVRVVTALHRHLRDGCAPASALARAQAECADLGFLCVGAG